MWIFLWRECKSIAIVESTSKCKIIVNTHLEKQEVARQKLMDFLVRLLHLFCLASITAPTIEKQ
jgi:hypothetical protein